MSRKKHVSRSNDGVVRLRRSKHTHEPITLPDVLLEEHLWFTGGSGFGKSALLLAPWVAQIIARENHSQLTALESEFSEL